MNIMGMGPDNRIAVSYERVSKEEQVENFSLEGQQDRTLEFMRARGWQFGGSYRDEGITATTLDRPDFQRMLRDAELGKFQIIVVWNLARFSRSLVDMLLLMRDLEKMGVAVVSVSEPFDFTTPIGKLLLTLLGAFAQWYIDNLRVEVKKGKSRRAKEGLWQNRLPFGYTTRSGGWKNEGNDEFAIPDEYTRQGYELVCDLAETGQYSYAQLAKALNEAGYRPTGRAGTRSLPLWSANSVRYMLRNFFYCGETLYNGVWFPGVHEPLITRERLERIHTIMHDRQRVSSFKARSDSRFYLLSGMVKCAECGSSMRGEYKQYGPEKPEVEYLYYRCAARLRGLECSSRPYLRAEVVEGAVQKLLTRPALSKDWQVQIHATKRRLMEVELTAPKVVNREAEVKKLEARLVRLKDLYDLGDIEWDDYLNRRNDLKARIAQATPQASKQLEQVASTVITLASVWDIATPAERQRLVREVIDNVAIQGDNIHIAVKPEYRPFFTP